MKFLQKMIKNINQGNGSNEENKGQTKIKIILFIYTQYI